MHKQERYFEDIEAGMALAPMSKIATTTQLFLFSAATNNPHRIHYDKVYAAKEGHPDILVHGPLRGAWLAQYITSWMWAFGPAEKIGVPQSRTCVS